jgi:hypothetical protein
VICNPTPASLADDYCQQPTRLEDLIPLSLGGYPDSPTGQIDTSQGLAADREPLPEHSCSSAYRFKSFPGKY